MMWIVIFALKRPASFVGSRREAILRVMLMGLGAPLLARCAASPALVPTARQLSPANIAGSWWDSADFSSGDGSVAIMTITQRGDSFTVATPSYWQHYVWDGVSWWQRAYESPDSSFGTIVGDSVTFCQPSAPPCPSAVGFVRDNDEVLTMYAPFSVPLDTFGYGFTYRHGGWLPADTVPPVNAPPPVKLAGAWISDTAAWSGASCPGVVQIALVISGPVSVNGGYAQGQEWARGCGGQPWVEASSSYVVSTSANPCTPANECELSLTGAGSDNWALAVASTDSLADDTPVYINTGYLPHYFLRDHRAPSWTRIALQASAGQP